MNKSNTSSYTPISREEEKAIFVQIKSGDDIAREDFILNNRGLVVSNAEKLNYLRPPHISINELCQSGFIGLITAVDKFDPEKGRFSTYATYWIQAEMRQFLDHIHSSPNPGLHRARAIKKLGYVEGTLTQELGRPPMLHEVLDDERVQTISSKVGLTVEQLLQLRVTSSDPTSLDQNITSTDGNDLPLLHVIPDDKDMEKEVELRDIIDHLLQPLDERERLVLSHYFGLGGCPKLTYQEISDRFFPEYKGQGNISHIAAKAIKKLRDFANTDEDMQFIAKEFSNVN